MTKKEIQEMKEFELENQLAHEHEEFIRKVFGSAVDYNFGWASGDRWICSKVRILNLAVTSILTSRGVKHKIEPR